MNLDDVRVRELRTDARLLDEHVDVVLERAVLRLDVLDRDGALETRGTANHTLVDRRHPALACDADELILAIDRMTAEIHEPSLQRLG